MSTPSHAPQSITDNLEDLDNACEALYHVADVFIAASIADAVGENNCNGLYHAQNIINKEIKRLLKEISEQVE